MKAAFRYMILLIFTAAVNFTACSPEGKHAQNGGSTVETPAAGPNTSVIPSPQLDNTFLLSELIQKDGSPLAFAVVELVENEFEVETNEAGQFSIPMDKITRRALPVKITTRSPDKLALTGSRVSFLSDIELPADILKSINAVRAVVGVPPLDGSSADPSSSGTPTVPNETNQFLRVNRRMSLQLPENAQLQIVSQSEDNGTAFKISLLAGSLPLRSPTQTKSFGMWTTVENQSTNSIALFRWKDGLSTLADVRIAYSKDSAALSAWDGTQDVLPRSGGEGVADVVVISDFSSCTAVNESTQQNGKMTSAIDAACGFDMSLAPFADGSDTFFRVAGESETEVRLSIVYALRAGNQAPVLGHLRGRYSLPNTPLSDVLVRLDDPDSTLSCLTAISVRSSNTRLLPEGNVRLSGTVPDCRLSLFSAPNMTGSTTVTVTAGDGSLVDSKLFHWVVSSSNSGAHLNSISNQVTLEDTPTHAAPVTIVDLDGPWQSCRKEFFSYTSDNTELVAATGALEWSGIWPNCSFRITPNANASGLAKIAVKATDGFALGTEQSFLLSVSPVNDTPTLSHLPDVSAAEDSELQDVIVALNDIDETLSCSEALTGVSSNTLLLPSSNISFSGSGSLCFMKIVPQANQSGKVTITLRVTDSQNAFAEDSFLLTVNPVNDAPSMTEIADQTIAEDGQITAIPFTISDSDSTIRCISSVIRQSTNTNLIPSSNIVVSGSGQSCLLSIYPLPNKSGTANVILTVSDGSPLTQQQSIDINVTAVNDRPTLSFITDKTTSEDTPLSNIPVLTSDIDSSLSCTHSISVAADNPSLLPSAAVTFSGSVPDCRMTLAPAADRNGSTRVTLTVSDGELSHTSGFQLTVQPVDDAPRMSPIPSPQTTDEDTTKEINLTLGDSDGDLNCSSAFLLYTSSNETIVPAFDSVVWRGVWPECVARISPARDAHGTTELTFTVSDGTATASQKFTFSVFNVNDAPIISTNTSSKITDEDIPRNNLLVSIQDADDTLNCISSLTATSSNATLLPVANIVFSGTPPSCYMSLTPAAEQSGMSRVTLTLSDGKDFDTDSFEFIVYTVNDPPQILAIQPQATAEDNASPQVTLSITDIDASAQVSPQPSCTSTYLSYVSETPALVSSTGAVAWGGTWPNCTAIITPLPNATGQAILSFAATDGYGTGPQQTFALTITPENDAPTISDITNRSTPEDTPLTNLQVRVADIDNTLNCTNALSATSNNPSLIANSAISISGTGTDCRLHLSPAQDQSGSATLTVTVTDGQLTAQDSFVLTVNAVNDAPFINPIAQQSTDEDTTSAEIPFLISDIDGPPQSCTGVFLSMNSSNSALVASTGAGVWSGTWPNCALRITPQPHASGNVQITVNASDATATSAGRTFTLTVNPVNDVPIISDISDLNASEDSISENISVTVSDIDSTLNCATALTAQSSQMTLLPADRISFSGTAPHCKMRLIPALDQSGSALVTVMVSDGSLMAQDSLLFTVQSVNDAPTLAPIPTQTSSEDTDSSAIQITISDTDGPAQTCHSSFLSYTSSNAAIVATTGAAAWGGSWPHCTVVLTPSPDQSGNTLIGIRVNDGSAVSSEVTFTLNVAPVNDPPEVSAFASQSTNEDTPLGNLVIQITDKDGPVQSCSSSFLSYTSSDPSIVASTGAIVWSGTWPSCRATMTPVANAVGSANVGIRAGDGISLSQEQSFAFTVLPLNDPPTVEAISNHSTSEDTVSPLISVTIRDVDGPERTCSSSSLAYESLSPSVLSSGDAVTWGGTWPQCTAVFTPRPNANGSSVVRVFANDGLATSPPTTFILNVGAVNDAPVFVTIAPSHNTNEDVTLSIPFTSADADGALSCSSTHLSYASSNPSVVANTGAISWSGMWPNCIGSITPMLNATGNVEVALTVTDGILSASTAILLAVNPTNDPPTLADITNKIIDEDTSLNNVFVTMEDVDNSLSCSTAISVESSNTILIPSGQWSVTGSAPQCVLSLVPALNQSGSSTITLRVFDGTLTATDSFVLSVNPVNDPPELSPMDGQFTSEDTNTNPLSFTIADVDGPARNCQASSLTYTSSNPHVVAAAGAVTWGGTWPACTAIITPVLNATGSSEITFKASDGLLLSQGSAFNLSVTAVNDAPALGALSAVSTNEDTPTTPIALTVSDVDGPNQICASPYLSYTSGTTSVVAASSAVTWGGSWPHCTATFSPVPNTTGSALITVKVSDGSLTSAGQSFLLTVSASNDPPSFSSIADQMTTEDSTVASLPFTVIDVDGPSQSCSSSFLSYTSTNTAVVASSGAVVWGGTWPHCTVSISPLPNAFGSTSMTLAANDSIATGSSQPFTLTVLAVNDAPVLAPLSAVTINEDIPTNAINLTITDIDGPAQNCNENYLSYTSSIPTVVASSGAVAWSGTWPNCKAIVTPVANGFGNTIMTFFADDGLAKSTGRAFTLTVLSANDAPTMGLIASPQITPEDTAKSIAFNVGDADAPLACTSSFLRYTSSNVALIAATSAVTWSGTWPNCTGTVLPVQNATGSTYLTFQVTDGVLSAERTFIFSITAVNDAPTISNLTDMAINEDTLLNTASFTIGDIESTLSCSSALSAHSSNSSLLPISSMSWGGTAPNCTLTLNPASNQSGVSTVTLHVTDGTLSTSSSFAVTVSPVNDAPTINPIGQKSTFEDTPSSAVSFSINDVDGPTRSCDSNSLSYTSSNTSLVEAINAVSWDGAWPNCTAVIAPRANGYGQTTLAFRASDGSAQGPATSFTFEITALPDTPTISAVADQSTAEDSPLNSLLVVIGDADTPLVCSTHLTAQSNNTSLLPATGITIGGNYPNCTVTLTPVTDVHGHTTVTLTVSDGTLSAQNSFEFTVIAANDAPTVGAITNRSTNEDTATTSIAFTISDVDGPARTCDANSLSYTSENHNIVSANGSSPSAVTWGGIWPQCTAIFTPVANAHGSLALTIYASDGTAFGAGTRFTLTVLPLNDAPTLADILTQTTTEDTPLNGVPVTIGDVDAPLSCATALSKNSSNTILLPVANISFGGTFPNCIVNLIPASNINGTSSVTLTVADGSGGSASDIFSFSVSPQNDSPSVSDVTDKITSEDTPLQNISFSISDIDSSLSCASSVFATSSNSSLVLNSDIVVGGNAPNCTISLTPVPNRNGFVTITLLVDDGFLTTSDSFVLGVTAVNDPPTIENIPNQTTNEDTALHSVSVKINDVDGPLVCSSALSRSSTNSNLIPISKITFAGTYPNCTVSLIPEANMNGNSTITLTANDGAGGSASDTFVFTVSAVNDAPSIAGLMDISVGQTASRTMPFTIDDIDSTVSCASVSFSSANENLISSSNIAISGTAPLCRITMIPSSSLKGTTPVSLSLSDSLGGSTSSSFFLTVIGLWQQEAYIKASNTSAISEAVGDGFGTSAAISGDTLAVAAPYEDSSQTTITTTTTGSNNNLSDSGAVYVYRRSSTTGIWSLESFIKPATGAAGSGDLFGQSLALSGDTLAVGIPLEDANQKTITSTVPTLDGPTNQSGNSGAVFVYRRTGSNWGLDAFLKPSVINAGDGFGTSVGISGDTLVVGASGEDSNQVTVSQNPLVDTTLTVSNSGAAYIFQRNAVGSPWWTQEAYLKAANANASDSFGSAVAIWGDTAAISAPKEDANQTIITNLTSVDNSSLDSGAVYLFRRSGNTSPFWGLEAYVKASNTSQTTESTGDAFGSVMTLNGNALAVGVALEDSNQSTITNASNSSTNSGVTDSGAVFIYRRNATSWSQEAYIKASNANSGDGFGSSLSLNGSSLAVGAPMEDSNLNTITVGSTASYNNTSTNSGAVYTYLRSESGWAQDAYIKASNTSFTAESSGDAFGSGVSISGDLLMISAPREDSNETAITTGEGSSANNSSADSGAIFVHRNLSRLSDPDVRITGVTATSITFSWSANLGNTNQVKVAPASNGTATPVDCNDPTAVVLATGATSYTYSGLSSGNKYGFRFCAWDGSNASAGTTIWGMTP